MAMIRAWVVGACALLMLQPQTARGQGTCQYARDGECDEPRYGTGVCRPGTDLEDCKNSCTFAFDGECDEPRNCVAGTDTSDCQSTTASSSSSRQRRPPPPSPPEDGFEEFEQEERDISHDPDGDGWKMLVGVIVLLTVMFFPCIVFMCAWCMCINQRSGQGACGSTCTPTV